MQPKPGKAIDKREAPIAQLDRALPSEGKGCAFKSHRGRFGRFVREVDAESEDGLLKTSPTGIKEKEMQWITDNQTALLGKIITAKCSGVSQDHLGNYSLLHPVYKHVRDDKSTADTLANILDIEAMAKGLK